MKPTNETERLGPALLEVVGYAVTSARTLLDETPTYGPLRLLEVAKRILGAMIGTEDLSSESVLNLRDQLDNAVAALVEGEDAFRTRLDLLVKEMLKLE
jgi:hypothetical protein